MESSVQGSSKEQFMLKLMQRFMVLAFVGIGACILLAVMPMLFFSVSTSSPIAVGAPEVVQVGPAGPAVAAPQAQPIPISERPKIGAGWIIPVAFLATVAMICAVVYNMFRMYLQYKASHDIDGR
jgi:hypothetical protein